MKAFHDASATCSKEREATATTLRLLRRRGGRSGRRSARRTAGAHRPADGQRTPQLRRRRVSSRPSAAPLPAERRRMVTRAERPAHRHQFPVKGGVTPQPLRTPCTLHKGAMPPQRCPRRGRTVCLRTSALMRSAAPFVSTALRSRLPERQRMMVTQLSLSEERRSRRECPPKPEPPKSVSLLSAVRPSLRALRPLSVESGARCRRRS